MAISSFNLSDLNGSNGFRINGINAGDLSGWSVSDAGDINGDGFADLIIGAPFTDPNSLEGAGSSYVVFGGTNVGSSGNVNLSELNGSNGFVINGINAGDQSGWSVSGAGDINGDGFADLIIRVPFADPNGLEGASSSYVVFGGTNVGSSGNINLSELNGNNGFVINSIAPFDASGESVSNAGDINGDGFADLIIGAPGAGSSGSSYVIFGGTTVGSSGNVNLSELNGSNGFLINGIDWFFGFGWSVSSAGDINGDSFADLIANSLFPIAGTNYLGGRSYVVFGGTNVGLGGSINLNDLNGSNGFVINDVNTGEAPGISVSSAGDINADGFADLIIGAPGDAAGNSLAVSSYVVFGGTNVGLGGSINLSDLNGSNGFVINGITAFDLSGSSVSGAGDINDDGIDDLIIGAPEADPNGESYVVFGSHTVGAGGSLNLADLNGNNGFVINGIIDANDLPGASVSSAGDINGDGIADLNWDIGGTGDFDSDGQIDILWRNDATGENAVWLMNGTNLNQGVFITPVADLNWDIGGTGDFNNDGQTDILWRNGAKGENAVWLMNGTNLNQGVFTTPVADLNWQIVA